MLIASFLFSILLGAIFLQRHGLPLSKIFVEQFKLPTTYLDLAAYALIAGYSSLFLHECGHYFWLKIIGMDNVKIFIGMFGAQVTHGTPYSRMLTPFEYQVLGFAGFGTMRLIAAFSNFVSEKLKFNSWQYGLLGAVYLFNRMAVVFGIEQAFVGKNDLSVTASAVAISLKTTQWTVLAFLAVIILIDIYLSRENIFQNAKRVIFRRSAGQFIK